MSRFIKTPILDRLALALRQELDSLTVAELIQLERECKRTTCLNCEASRYMIAEHYKGHVSAVIRNKTVRYIRDGRQITHKEFWQALHKDLADPETGKLSFMEPTRKELNSGKVITAGQAADDMHSYQITYQV